MKKTKKLPILIVTLAVAGGVFGIVKMRQKGGDNEGRIRVSGNIEVTTVQIAFRIPGRVAARLVDEGASVTNGQIVARLDTIELAQDLAMRRAEALTAAAILEELEAGTRPEEIAQAEAALAVTRAEQRRAASELKRQEGLFGQEVVPERALEAAQADAGAAEAKVREAEARLALLKEGPRQESIRAARARLERARQAVAMSETRLGYATIRSPLNGIVLAEGLEPGEFAAAGAAVVTVGDLANVWLRGYINEPDLGRVRIGQEVGVVTDTYPGKVYPGRLSFIASQAEFTPKNVQTTEERVKLVYRIKVDIANPGQELKPGMPADAEIRTGAERQF